MQTLPSEMIELLAMQLPHWQLISFSSTCKAYRHICVRMTSSQQSGESLSKSSDKTLRRKWLGLAVPSHLPEVGARVRSRAAAHGAAITVPHAQRPRSYFHPHSAISYPDISLRSVRLRPAERACRLERLPLQQFRGAGRERSAFWAGGARVAHPSMSSCASRPTRTASGSPRQRTSARPSTGRASLARI